MDCLEKRAPHQSTRHPWEMARFHFFSRVLKKSRILHPETHILDIGAGDGWFSSQLAHFATLANPIVCWDSAYGDTTNRPVDTGPDIQFEEQRPREQFQLLLLLDVLEHVPDDNAFLRSLVTENLQPGGYALISVPCWPTLFSQHDEFLGHKRRYTLETMKDVIRSSGLVCVRCGGLFYSLLMARALLLWRQRLFKLDRPHAHLGDAQLSTPVRWLLFSALWLDAELSQVVSSLGFRMAGLSGWALCQKL